MNRTTKQVAYGVFYLGFCLAIVFTWRALMTVRPPTCTDGIRNGQETEVDCGGDLCQSCEIKRLTPIQFSKVILLPSFADGGTTALIEIRNTNAAFGTARLAYSLGFYGDGVEALYEEADAVMMYPSEVKYRLVVNAPVPFSENLRAVATTTAAIAWRPITEFIRPKMTLRERKFEYSGDTRRGAITGFIRNDHSTPLRRVTINAIVYDKNGALVTASKTFVQDLRVSEERAFRIDVRLPEDVVQGSLGDPEIYLDAE